MRDCGMGRVVCWWKLATSSGGRRRQTDAIEATVSRCAGRQVFPRRRCFCARPSMSAGPGHRVLCVPDSHAHWRVAARLWVQSNHYVWCVVVLSSAVVGRCFGNTDPSQDVNCTAGDGMDPRKTYNKGQHKVANGTTAAECCVLPGMCVLHSCCMRRVADSR